MRTDLASAARVTRRSLAALTIAVLTAAMLAPVATAGWEESEIESSFLLTRPALITGPDGTGYVAFQRVGSDPGIFVTADVWGTPVTARVSDGADMVPSLAIDGSDKLHVAFLRVDGSPGAYYATNASGSWVVSQVAADTVGSISLALDASGKAHVAYSSLSFSPGIYESTNATGSWTRTRVSAAAHDEWPSVAVDGSGAVKVAFARYDAGAPGIHLATWTGSAWSTTRLTTHVDDTPVLRIDTANKVHLVYDRIRWTSGTHGGSPIVYGTNASGSYVETLLPSDNDDGIPSLALGPSGTVAVAWVAYQRMAWPPFWDIKLRVRTAGTWGDVPSGSRPGDSLPSVAVTGTGDVQLAYRRRLGPDVGIHAVSQADGARYVATADLSAGPDLELDGSDRERLTWSRIAKADESGVQYGLRDAGVWAVEEAQAEANTTLPRIALEPDGTPHVVSSYPDLGLGDPIPLTALVKTGDSWLIEQDTEGSSADIAVHGTAIHTVYETKWGEIRYATNEGGSWTSFQITGTDTMDYRPSIAVDANGKVHIVYWSDMGGGSPRIMYVTNATGSWQWKPLAVTAASYGRPAIALDAAGKAHIAYLRGGTAGGVSYTMTLPTGSLATTTLTRSWADGDPSIAVGASGKVYVAVPRWYWAANPGVVLVTYDGGPVVQTMVSARTDVNAVSLDVAGDGLVRMVLEQDWAGLQLLEETAAGGGALAPVRVPEPGLVDEPAAGGATIGMAAIGMAADAEPGAPVPAASRPGGGAGGRSR